MASSSLAPTLSTYFGNVFTSQQGRDIKIEPVLIKDEFQSMFLCCYSFQMHQYTIKLASVFANL